MTSDGAKSRTSLSALQLEYSTPLHEVSNGLGIGKLAASAMEGIARQPEAAPKIQTAMLIAAALIEGIGLFCAVICFLAIK